MSKLPRLKPDPIPTPQPLPEYLAEGQRKLWYEEMKAAFQVPWMGVVTMAFSHYPTFYRTLWEGARALLESEAFVQACRDNRAFVEAEIEALSPPPIAARLTEIGYAPREIQSIRDMIEVFSHGNQPYVLLATLARYLLEAGDMGGSVEPAPRFEERHAPAVSVPFVLMEMHHADEATRAVYQDVMQTLGLPFVNTDYRAFARWPSYWALAWSDLRGAVQSESYAGITEAFHHRCVDYAAVRFPNPSGLSAEALRAAAEQDGEEEIREVVRLFQWLLPGLIANVAYLRAQLLEDER